MMMMPSEVVTAQAEYSVCPTKYRLSKTFTGFAYHVSSSGAPGARGGAGAALGTGAVVPQRFVASPGHDVSGILHMPGGQSGHPLSAHYSDQQSAWVDGRPLPLLPGAELHTLTLTK